MSTLAGRRVRAGIGSGVRRRPWGRTWRGEADIAHCDNADSTARHGAVVFGRPRQRHRQRTSHPRQFTCCGLFSVQTRAAGETTAFETAANSTAGTGTVFPRCGERGGLSPGQGCSLNLLQQFSGRHIHYDGAFTETVVVPVLLCLNVILLRAANSLWRGSRESGVPKRSDYYAPVHSGLSGTPPVWLPFCVSV